MKSRININLSTDKETYTQREKTTLTIKTSLDEVPSKANLSLLVFNKEEVGKIKDLQQNILSYFLLSSDLKGEIENPAYYFGNDSNRQESLDALMLTQGWRKYLYTKPLGVFDIQPQKRLTVSGNVSGLIFRKKKMQDIGLSMMTFGKKKTVHLVKTDSLGRFTFELDNEFGQNLNILIQSSDKSGKKKGFHH